MTHTTEKHFDEQAELLAAIAASPEEDTPRLAFADWLQEQEPVRVPCLRCEDRLRRGQLEWGACPECKGKHDTISTAHADRSEFIRVQIRNAATRQWLYTHEAEEKYPGPIRQAWRERMEREEFALLAANETAWRRAGVCVGCKGDGGLKTSKGNHITKCSFCHGTGDVGGLLRELPHSGIPCTAGELVGGKWLHKVEWERGFPKRIVVPRLADAVEVCPDCKGEPIGACNFGRGVEYPQCCRCSGTGHVPSPWLAAVVRHWPVTEVVPLDREPEEWVNGFAWYKEGQPWTPRPHMELPVVIFDLMEDGQLDASGMTKRYDTRELVVTALARAIAQFSRNSVK